MSYSPTPADLAHVDGTVASAAEKYLTLASGGRTALLDGIEAELSAITDGADFTPLDPTQLVFELWESGGSIAGFPFHSRPTDIQDRFTSMTLPYWMWTEEYAVTPISVRDFLSSTSFPVFWTLQGLSNYSSVNVRNALIAADSPEAWNSIRLDHPVTTVGDRLNLWNGDVLELIVKAACVDIANLVAKNPFSAGVLLTTEYDVAGTPGDIADAVAADNGIDPLVLWPPVVGVEGVPYQAIVTDADATYRSLWWHYLEADKYQFNRQVRGILGGVTPSIETSEDYQFSVDDVLGCDRIHSWVVANDPNIPLLVDYFAELALAKDRYRSTSTTIVVGSQIATRYVVGPTTYYRPTPLNLYQACSWLSLTSGISRGLTGWGLTAIFDTDGNFRENGEVLWEYLAEMRSEIDSTLNDLMMSWTPMPRRTAVLYSVVDKDLYGSGWNYQPITGITPCTRRWQSMHSTTNVYFATRWAGEPCDILLDKDLDSFDDYTVLIIGCLHVAHRELIQRIVQFMDDGGTVIVHDGSVLESAGAAALGIDPSKLEILDDSYGTWPSCLSSLGFYWATYSSSTYVDYYEFLGKVADGIDAKLPGGARYRNVPRGVITNHLQSGGKEYIAFVNCGFEYGAEEAWLRGIGGRAGHVCEVGVPVTFANSFDAELTDITTPEESSDAESYDFGPRQNVAIGGDITLVGGGHKIYEFEPHSSSSPSSRSCSSWSSGSVLSSLSTSSSSSFSSSSSSISSVSSSSSVYVTRYQQVLVGATVVEADVFLIPAETTQMELQADVFDIRYTMDGSTPGATVGMLLRNGANPKAFLAEDLLQAKFIASGGAAAVLNVSYFGGQN